MVLALPARRILIETAETLAIALAGGLLFAYLKLPAGLVSGSVLAVATAALLWLGRIKIQVTAGADGVEMRAGEAHLPVTVIARSADIPRSAKSAALGRQLDPAAFVVHRGWVGPMVLVVLEDADDPTPYWLVSSRHPGQVLSALRS